VITGHFGATGGAGNAMSAHLEVSACDRLVHGFILPLLITAGLIVAIEAGMYIVCSTRRFGKDD
jgi:hypothetical protein